MQSPGIKRKSALSGNRGSRTWDTTNIWAVLNRWNTSELFFILYEYWIFNSGYCLQSNKPNNGKD